MKCKKGTKPYMAPEIMEEKEVDARKVDVFALGVLLFQIVMGRFPFNSAQKEDPLYNLIVNGK